MWLVNKLLKSEFAKAWILSKVRLLVASAGATLVLKGYADEATIEAAAGLAVVLVSFWMSDRDVKGVDKKIEAALNTPIPTGPTQNPDLVYIDDKPSPKNISEEEITRQLNEQARHGK